MRKPSISITLSAELYEQLEKRRQNTNRSEYIEQVLIWTFACLDDLAEQDEFLQMREDLKNGNEC